MTISFIPNVKKWSSTCFINLRATPLPLCSGYTQMPLSSISLSGMSNSSAKLENATLSTLSFSKAPSRKRTSLCSSASLIQLVQNAYSSSRKIVFLLYQQAPLPSRGLSVPLSVSYRFLSVLRYISLKSKHSFIRDSHAPLTQKPLSS